MARLDSSTAAAAEEGAPDGALLSAVAVLVLALSEDTDSGPVAIASVRALLRNTTRESTVPYATASRCRRKDPSSVVAVKAAVTAAA